MIGAGHWRVRRPTWTLEKVFGVAFTGEVRNAWATLYRIVAETMLKATAATTQAREGRSASA
jgi:hypothetical protein